MRKFTTLVIGAAVVVAVAVAAQDRQPDQAPAAGSQDRPAPQSPAAASAAQAPAPAEFLKNVSQSNRAEIELGQLAQTKAQNDDVKAYARMLVQDHTKVNQEVTSMARTMSVTLPADIAAAQKATQDTLTGLSGAAFDKAYIDAMVENHQKGVASFRQATMGTDEDVRVFAEKTLPTLRHHLEEAQRLQQNLK
jgi:putative membrane protein